MAVERKPIIKKEDEQASKKDGSRTVDRKTRKVDRARAIMGLVVEIPISILRLKMSLRSETLDRQISPSS